MKKFFFFAASIMAAMTINATVYDLTTLTAESDWTVEGATKNSTSTDTKLVYDTEAGVEATIVPTKVSSDITFSIKNTETKAKAFNINLGKCFEFGGKNGILKIENVKSGATIKLVVAAKGSTAANFADEAKAYPKGAVAVTKDLTCPAKNKGAEGADEEGYIWKTLEYTANDGIVEIKEFAGGYRIQSIEISGTTANENVKAEVKAVKSIDANGQLVILKNGVKYNALGAVVE